MNSVTSLMPPIDGVSDDRVVLAFALSPDLAEAIGAALPRASVRSGDIGAAIQAMSQQQSADLVIVELGDIDLPEGTVNSLRTVCGGEMRILVMGNVNDVALYRGLIAAGADDYLVHPAGNDALARAVERLMSSRAMREDKAQGAARKIFVTSARRGAGVSSFVTGAAWHLAEKRKLKIALIDLDLTFGTAALGFDIEPSHALREVLENPERVDGLFIESALAQVTENLAILAAEEDLSDPAMIRPGAMELLFQELSSSHDCILIDIPLAEILAEPRLLAHADSLVVFSEMNLTAIRDILRIRDFISANDLDVATTIIAGKTPAKDKSEVPHKEFSRSLSMAVDHSLPFDPTAAAQAAKNGRAVTDVAPKSELARAIAKTAETLCEDLLSDVPTGGIWQRLKRKG